MKNSFAKQLSSLRIENNLSRVGKTTKVLTEKSGHRNGTYIARDEAYRSIALKGNYKPGTWLNVQIEKAETFALLAKEVL